MLTKWTAEVELLGRVTVACSPAGLVAVTLAVGDHARAASLRRQLGAFEERRTALADDALRQLREYTVGARTAFELPLAPRGTLFQHDVWRALSTVPYGQTRTYSELAALIGRPSAARAVGAANGANPLCVIVPCHRLIGANGELTDYAYGLALKQRLLDLEAQSPA